MRDCTESESNLALSQLKETNNHETSATLVW